MGFSINKEYKTEISYRSDYRYAIFGPFFVAFADNDEHIYMAEEDKESLSEMISFYEKRIVKLYKAPVYYGYDGECVMYQPNQRECLRQYLGLPEELFRSLDISKDILSQIHFKEGLSNLRKECYLSFYRQRNRKWFNDDFKLYCVRNGIYFLYDETKPFIEGKNDKVPVFIDRDNMSEEMQKIYDNANSERFAIDILGEKVTSELLKQMRPYDIFSFDERISYFLNGQEDERIRAIPSDPKFIKEYKLILKKFLSSMINKLYDDYSMTCLQTLTKKTSYMTISRLDIDTPFYVISSYNGEMYSKDRRNWSFASLMKERISEQVSRVIQENPEAEILIIYAKLGLPYFGYDFLKEMKEYDTESIMKALPFSEEISLTDDFMSFKRVDVFYSYLSAGKEHLQVVLNRFLNGNGVEIRTENPIFSDDLGKITVSVDFSSIDNEMLSSFMTGKGVSLTEEILPVYYQDYGIVDSSLDEKVKEIDGNAKGNALSLFYSEFRDAKIDESCVSFLAKIDCQHLYTPELVSFFRYVLFFPYKIGKNIIRRHALQEKNAYILKTIDGSSDIRETYEPNLPYSYVSYGKICYSFRERLFSKPYVCLSEKEGIERKIDHLLDIYQGPDNIYDRNSYIIANLGLPDNIRSSLNPFKEIKSQISYKSGICHLCNKAVPAYHEKIDDNEAEPYNSYLTYIRNETGKHGLFIDDFVSPDQDVDLFYEKLDSMTFHGFLDVDISYVDPVLLPYIHMNKKKFSALMTSFFQEEAVYEDYLIQLISFANTNEDILDEILFRTKNEEYPLINTNLSLMTRVCYLYKMIETGYALHVCSPLLGIHDSEFTLNHDYNPKLPYPHILLGKTYNAFRAEREEDDFYICECDKDSLLTQLKRIAYNYESKNFPRDIETAIILSLSGLPYEAVVSLADYDLSINDMDGLISRLKFREGICRRCLNVAYCAYDEPFRKAYPFKEDNKADYDYVYNGMAQDGFKLISDIPAQDIIFSDKHRYEVNAYSDSYIPYLESFLDSGSEQLFTFFLISEDVLFNAIENYRKRWSLQSEALASGCAILMDASNKDHEIFCKFLISGYKGGEFEGTMKERAEHYFPELLETRKDIEDSVIQTMLGFFTYLIEELIRGYAMKEYHIGK